MPISKKQVASQTHVNPAFRQHSLLGQRLKLQLLNALRWYIYVSNWIDNIKLPCYTLPPTQHHTFSRKLPPFTLSSTFPDNLPTGVSINAGYRQYTADCKTSYRRLSSMCAGSCVGFRL